MKWTGERFKCRNCGEIYPYSLSKCSCGGVCDKISDAPKPDNTQKPDPSISPDSHESKEQNSNLTDKKGTDNSDQQSNKDENKEAHMGCIGCLFFIFLCICTYGGIRMLFNSSGSTLSDPVVKLKDIDDHHVKISWNPITNADFYVLQNQRNDLPESEPKTIILRKTEYTVRRDDNLNTEYSLIAYTKYQNYKSSSSVKIFIESAKSHSMKTKQLY